MPILKVHRKGMGFLVHDFFWSQKFMDGLITEGTVYGR